MTTAIKATHVRFSERHMLVEPADGRAVSVSIDRYPILSAATAEQRNAWALAAYGAALCWETIDEDISIEGMLRAPDAEVFGAKRARRRSRGR